MSEDRFDVVGIGNAIVDVIARADEALLERLQLLRGHMRLIEDDEVRALYAAMGPAIEVSGGSVANTMVGIASFGGRAGLIGKIADDEFGRVFRHDVHAAGVGFETPSFSGGLPTARSLILVTPDGQRTMNTYLGIARELGEGEVDPGVIEGGRIVYLEGYLFDRPAAKRAFVKAANIAHVAGRKVALTLSDGFCVDRHRPEFLALVRDKVDIVFANIEELVALYQAPLDEALQRIRADVPLAAITRSAAGSLIIRGEETVEIEAEPVDAIVDTTGAGDLYAAGFLYGHARGLPLATCGRLASIAAGEVISHLGARPETGLAGLARERGVEI